MKMRMKTGRGLRWMGDVGTFAAWLTGAALMLAPAPAVFGQDGANKATGDKATSFGEQGTPAAPGAGTSGEEGGKDSGSGIKSTRIVLNIDVPTGTTLILPRYPGAIIAFWESGRGRVLSYDVRTGRQVALTQKPMELKDPVLSSDGGMLATEKRGYVKNPKTGESAYSQTVEVWNLRTNAKVNTIEFPGKDGAQVLDFGGGTKILVAVKPQREGVWVLEVWDYKANELLGMIDLDKEIKEVTLGADPQGKTLVYATEPWGSRENSKIVLVDIATEKPRANQLKLKDPSGKPVTGASGDWNRTALGGLGVPMAVRFSPDSKLLAIAFPGNSNYSSAPAYVGVYDVESGEQKQLINVRGGEDNNGYRNPSDVDIKSVPLQWTPDSGRILVTGDAMYDVESGELVYRVPFKNEDYYWSSTPRLLFGNDYLLRSQELSKGWDRVIKYEAVRLPADRINKAIQALRSGGDMLDGFLPPLKETSIRDVAAKPVQGAGRTGVEPDPGTPVTLTQKASFPIELPEKQYQTTYHGGAEFRRPSGLLFPVNPSDKALVYGKVFKEPDGDVVRPMTVVDTARGITAWYSNETTGGIPRGLSPDGHRMLLSYPRRSGERLDVYEMSSGFSSAKQLVGWIPAPVARGAAGAALMWCAMPDTDTVLTLSANGELVGWRLPEPTPLFKISGVHTGVTPAVSPGGKQIFFMSDKHVYCADSHTGKVLADVTGPIAIPEQTSQGQVNQSGRGYQRFQDMRTQMALSPDGKELCVTFSKRHMTCMVNVYQVKGEKDKGGSSAGWEFYDQTYSRFYDMGSNRQELCYMAPGHVLLPSGLLVQTSTGSPVIFYKILSDWWNLSQGRYWVVKWAPDQKKFLVESTQIPSDNVFKLSDRARREDYIVYDTPVKAKVDFTPAGECKDPKGVTASVNGMLKEMGLVEDPDAGMSFRVSASIRTDPERKYYTQSRGFFPFGFYGRAPEGPSYDAKQLVGRSELMRNGKLIWAGDANYGSPSSLSYRENEDVNRVINDATWEMYSSVIMQTTSSFPAMLMDYNRLDVVALGRGVEATKGDAGKALNELSEANIETLNVELKALKKYKPLADAWLKDAQELYTDLKANKLDPKKYRTEADSLQAGMAKALNVPTDVMAESTRQRLVSIKEGAVQAAKLYQEAYRAAAAMNAGRRSGDSPDSMASKANKLIEEQVKAGLDAIGARIKELEEKTKLAE
jgi:hypothetical protein